MSYKLSKQLSTSIKKEIGRSPNLATLHGAISKEIFPDLKRTALLIGDEVKLYCND